MAEHDHRRCARLIIFVNDRASQARLHSQPGVIAAGHGLPVDDLRLIPHHRTQFTGWSEGKEIAERAVWRNGARLSHFFKDLVAKERIRFYAWWCGHVRRAAPPAISERTPGLPFKQHQ